MSINSNIQSDAPGSASAPGSGSSARLTPETPIPSTPAVLASLLRADFTTQWRNRKSFMLILIVPVIIMISWKGLIDRLGSAFVLGNCITIGLIAIGLMGYSNSVARDRDKGIFQRLR
ncbi:MAG TPA: hypothetical protein VGM24_11665, partial [Puia sp.]